MNVADLAVLKAAHPLREIVARYVGGQRHINGRVFWLCPFHEERTPSFTITPDGGGFKCFGCGAKGDVIKFVMLAEGLDFKGALEFLGDDVTPTSPAKSQPLPKDDINDPKQRIEAARAIWRDALPAPGTPIETYLRCRGITAPIPPSIRYVPDLRHAPTGLTLPTMVAAVQGPDRQIMGIHRTFLRADGRGKVPFTTPKMMLGRCAQGAVRLAKAGPKLAVGEGIESCLSVLQETNIPVWAALSTSGMKALIKEVILLSDGDEAAEKAIKVASRRFMSEGRTVKVARPPEGTDFNDVLRTSQKAFSKIVSLDNYRNHDDDG